MLISIILQNYTYYISVYIIILLYYTYHGTILNYSYLVIRMIGIILVWWGQLGHSWGERLKFSTTTSPQGSKNGEFLLSFKAKQKPKKTGVKTWISLKKER